MRLIKKVWTKLYFVLEFPIRYIWGRDIFISYSRRDTFDYPENLVTSLQERVSKLVQEKKMPKTKLSFYLDKFVAPPGGKPPRSLIRHLRWSSMLVILGTEKALAPESFVTTEVDFFSRLGRKVILINVNNELSNIDFTESPWKEISGTAWEIESLEAVQNSEPSENVIIRILKSAEFTKQDKRLKQSVWATVMFVLLLLGGVAYISDSVIKDAQNKADIAVKDAQAKVEKANGEVRDAETRVKKANEDAERITKKAEKDVADAKVREDDANRKADDATKVANEKNKLALEKTKLADEKTKIANAAEKRADEETQKAEIAKEEATLANKQAKSNLAENYYNIAQTESLLNPMRAIPWIQKAIDTIPETDNRRAIYNLRALQLSRKVPYFVINTQLNPYSVKFNPDLDKALILSNNAEPAMWDFKTGAILSTPWNDKNNLRGAIQQPSFSPNGEWIAAFYYGPSTDKNRDNAVCFEIWKVADISNSHSFCPPELDSFSGFGFTSYGNQTPDIINIDFSPDSRMLIISYPKQNSREVLVWNIDSAKELTKIPSDITAENPLLPTGIEINENVTYVRDAKAARRKEKEWRQRNRILISKNPDNNYFVTFKNRDNGTIAELREINSGKIKDSLELEKIVDFIGFTGDGSFIISLSHNPDAGRVYRIWNTNTGAKSENPAQGEFDIITINKTGNKLFLKDKNDRLHLYEWDGSESHYRYIVSDTFGVFDDIEATFSNDEKYIVTKSITSQNSTEGQWEINVWGDEKDSNELIQVGSSIKTEDKNFEISPSGRILGIMQNNGLLTMWNLVPNKEEQIFQFERLPAVDGYDISNFIVAPNLILTAESQLLKVTAPGFVNFGGSTPRIQIRNLADGQVKTSKGINLKFDSIRPPVDLSRDNSRFLTLENLVDQQNPNCQNKVSVRNTGNAEEINNSQLICDGFIYQAVFNRAGDKIITGSNNSSNYNSFGVKQWDSLTGAEDKSKFTEITWQTSGQFTFFTRYGEFVVTSRNYSLSERDFKIRSTDPQKNTSIHFEFSNTQSFTLALALLRQAEEIKIQDDKSLIAVINPTLELTLKTENGETSIINNKTKLEIIAPNSGVREMKISADGQLLIGSFGKSLQVWETQTGLLVTDNLSIGQRWIVYFDFAPDGKNVFGVVQSGQIRSWYIGSPNDIPFWSAGIAEALSSSRINNSKIEYLLPNDYVTVRQKYIEELNRRKGDNTDAEYLLNILNP